MVMYMNTVIDNVNSIVIRNSKFICLIYNVNNLLDIDKYLNNVKDVYSNATHYCYGYIMDNIKKESDDGEPGGTAGIPILQVLEKNNLNRVLCVVVRYFGGIKLGAGGLVRAYTKSVTECLDGHIIELKMGYNITIYFDYRVIKQVDYILRDSVILNRDFNDNVVYNVNTTEDIIDKIRGIGGVDIVINESIYI